MARVVAVVGACGSVGLVFVGRRNVSLVLLLIFAIWVLAPILALLLADLVWKRGGAALYLLMLLVALGSLAVYGTIAFGPPRAKPAAFFLMLPFVWWVLIGIGSVLSSRRRT